MIVNQFWHRGKRRDLALVVPYKKTKIDALVRSGQWIEGLHYVVDDAGDRLYNLTLIADWVATLGDPTAHQRAIESYLLSLPSNQAAPAGRPRRAA